MSSPGGGYRGGRGYYNGPRFGGASSGYNHPPFRGENPAWRTPPPRFAAQFQQGSFRHSVRHHNKAGPPLLRFPGRFPGPSMRYPRTPQTPQEPHLGSEEERKRNISTTADKLKRTLSSITDEEKDHFWNDDLAQLDISKQEEPLKECSEIKDVVQELIEDQQRVKERDSVIYQAEVARSGKEPFGNVELDKSYVSEKPKKSKKKTISEHDANKNRTVRQTFQTPVETGQVSADQDYVNTSHDAVNQNNLIVACSEPLNKSFSSIELNPPLPKGDPPDSLSYLNPHNSYQLGYAPKSTDMQFQNGNPAEQSQMVRPVAPYQALEPPPEFNFQDLPEYELFPEPKTEMNCFNSIPSLQPPAMFDPRSMTIPLMSAGFPVPGGYMPMNYPVPYLPPQPMVNPPLPPLPPETEPDVPPPVPPIPEEIEEGLEDMQEAFAFARQLMDMSELSPVKKKKKKRKKSVEEQEPFIPLIPAAEIKLEPIPLPVPPPDYSMMNIIKTELVSAEVDRPRLASNPVKSNVAKPREWRPEDEIIKRPLFSTEREAEKPSNVQSKNHTESTTIDPVKEYHPRFADLPSTRAPEPPQSTVANRSNGSNHVSSHNNKPHPKSASEIEENNWKDKVINRFLKMSKNEICNMINNSSLRKFDLPMRHLMREKRTTMALEMRSSEEDKAKDHGAISEEFVSQLSAMLDPSAEVDIGNLPTAFIYHLNEFMQLGMDDLPPLGTNGEPEAVNEEEEKQRKQRKAKYEAQKQAERQREMEILKEKQAREEEARQRVLAERQVEFERLREIERKKNNERLQATQRKEHPRNTGFFIGEASSSQPDTLQNQVPEKLVVASAIDDIFSAGLMKNRSQPKPVSPPKVPQAISVKDRVPFGNNPALETYEKTTTDLDHIFSAGIAKALSKNSAAVRARKNEMDGYRNLSKEEWEACLRPPDNSDKDRTTKTLPKSSSVSQSPVEELSDSDSDDDSRSTSSSSGSSSESDNSVTSQDVTKILKSIKERDKDKKRSLNATIRDEVAAEIARKWKEQEKYKKTRGKKKKKDRKGKKKKVRKRHKKRGDGSSEESGEEVREKVSVVPTPEIKVEIRSEPEDNLVQVAETSATASSMLTVVPKTEKPSPLKTKAQLKLMPEDTSRPVVSLEKIDIFKNIEPQVPADDRRSPNKSVLTKAQLKTVESSTSNVTPVGKLSSFREISYPIVKSDIKLATPLRFTVTDVRSLKNGPPLPVPKPVPKVISAPGFTESGKRKLDVNEYKARLQQRKELQKNLPSQPDLKVNRLIGSLSSKPTLYDIPLPEIKDVVAKVPEVPVVNCEDQLKIKTIVERKESELQTPVQLVSDKKLPEANTDFAVTTEEKTVTPVCSDHHQKEVHTENVVKPATPEVSKDVDKDEISSNKDVQSTSNLATEKEPLTVESSEKSELKTTDIVQTKPTELEKVVADKGNESTVEVAAVPEEKEPEPVSEEVKKNNADTNPVPPEPEVSLSSESLLKKKLALIKAEPVVYLSRLPLKSLKKNFDQESLVNNVTKETDNLDANKTSVKKSLILPTELDVEKNQVPKSSESSKSSDEFTTNQRKSEDRNSEDLAKLTKEKETTNTAISQVPINSPASTETKKDDLSSAKKKFDAKVPEVTKSEKDSCSVKRKGEQVKSELKRIEKENVQESKKSNKQNFLHSRKFEKNELHRKVSKEKILEPVKSSQHETKEEGKDRRDKTSSEKRSIERMKFSKRNDDKKQSKSVGDKVPRGTESKKPILNKQTDLKIEPAREPKNETLKGVSNTGYRIPKLNRKKSGVHEEKQFNRDVQVKSSVQKDTEKVEKISEVEKRISPTISSSSIEEKPEKKIVEKRSSPTVSSSVEDKPEKKTVEKRSSPTVSSSIEEKPEKKTVEKKTSPTTSSSIGEKPEKKTVEKGISPTISSPIEEKPESKNEEPVEMELEPEKEPTEPEKSEETEIVDMYLNKENKDKENKNKLELKTISTSDALPDIVPNEAMFYEEMDTPLFNEIARISKNSPVADCGLFLPPTTAPYEEEEESCKEMTNLGQLDLDNASEIVYNDTINCNSLRLSSPKNDLKDDVEELEESSPRSSGSPFKGFSAETIELPYLQRPLFNLELDEIDNNAYSEGLDSGQITDLAQELVPQECSENIDLGIRATTPLLEETMVNKRDIRDFFDPLKEETVPTNLLEDEEPQGTSLEEKETEVKEDEEILEEKKVENKKSLRKSEEEGSGVKIARSDQKSIRREKSNQTEKSRISKDKEMEWNKKLFTPDKKTQINNNEVTPTNQVEKDSHRGSKNRHKTNDKESVSIQNEDKKEGIVKKKDKRVQDVVKSQEKVIEVLDSSDSDEEGTKVEVMKTIIQQAPYVLLEKSKDIEKLVNRHGSQNEDSSLHKVKKKHKKKKDKKRYTENQILTAIDEGLVEEVEKVNTRESVMARMIEIDLEIHKLVTEKFELYQLLQGGTLSSESELKDSQDELPSMKKDNSLTPEDIEPTRQLTPEVPSSSSKTSKNVSHRRSEDKHGEKSHRGNERSGRESTKPSKSRRDHSNSKERSERRDKSKTRERESSVRPVQKVFVIPRSEVDKINSENSSKIVLPDIKQDQGTEKKKFPIKNLKDLLPEPKKRKTISKDDCEEDEVKKRPSSRISNSPEKVKRKKMIIYSDESSADVDVSVRNEKKKLTGLSLLEETFRQEQKGSKKRQLKDSDDEDDESDIEIRDRQSSTSKKNQTQPKRKKLKKPPVMEEVVEKHINETINAVIENFSDRESTPKKKPRPLCKQKDVKIKQIDVPVEPVISKDDDKNSNLDKDVIVLGETQEDMDNESFVIEKCDKENSNSVTLGSQIKEVFIDTDSAGFGDNAVDFVLDPLKLNSDKKLNSKIEDHPSPNEEKLELFAQKILNSSESSKVAAEKAEDDCDKEVAAYEERAIRHSNLLYPRASTATPSSGLKYYTSQRNKIEKLNTPLFLVETRSTRSRSRAESSDSFAHDDNSNLSSCSGRNKGKSGHWRPSMFGQDSVGTSRTANDLSKTKMRGLTLDEMMNCKVKLEDSQYTLLAPDVSQEVLKSVGISKINVPWRETHKRSEPKEKTKDYGEGEHDVEDSPSSQPKKSDKMRQYSTHKGPILDIKVFNDSFLAASEDGMVYRYSLSSDQVLNVYKGHLSAVTCLCIQKMESSDQKKEWMYSGSLDGTLRCYDIKTGVPIKEAIEIGSPIQCMDASAWKTLYVGTKCGSIGRFKMKTSTLKEEIRFCDKSVLALKATYEGVRKVLIVAVRNQPITIRDAVTGLLLRTISGQKQHTVYSLLRSENLIYCGTSSTSIPVFDFITSQEIRQFNAGVGIVCMCLYKKLLFAGCYDGKIYVFNLQKSELVCSLPGPGNMLLSMEVVSKKIIAGSKDMNLKAWDMPEQIQDLIKSKR